MQLASTESLQGDLPCIECQATPERVSRAALSTHFEQKRLAWIQPDITGKAAWKIEWNECLQGLLCILMCLFRCGQLRACRDVGAMFESFLSSAHMDGRCDADVEAVCSTLKQLLAGVLGSREDDNLQSTCQSPNKRQCGCLQAIMRAKGNQQCGLTAAHLHFWQCFLESLDCNPASVSGISSDAFKSLST